MYSVCEVCVAAHYICCSKDLLMIIKHNQHLKQELNMNQYIINSSKSTCGCNNSILTKQPMSTYFPYLSSINRKPMLQTTLVYLYKFML